MEEIAKYIDNTLFIKWVYDPDEELDEYWSYYLNKHPEEKAVLISLKKELGSFRISSKRLSREQKELLAEKIFKKMQKQQKIRKISDFNKIFLKYAAMALLFFCLGGLIVYLNQKDTGGKLSYEVPFLANNPVLVFPDGNIVDLGKNGSEVDYTMQNRIIVNTDSIIPLDESQKGTGQNQMLVPFGCRARLTLSDRTVVWLNAGSRLIYPSVFTGKERKVILLGEGFFEVAKNKSHPFIVETSDYRIRVLGTRFNVSAYPGDRMSQTVLVEGSIQLTLDQSHWFGKRIILKPNELFTYKNGSKFSQVEKVDPDRFMQWKEGIFQFEDEDLNEVLKKLEHYYNIRIDLENMQDGTKKLNGKLNLKNDVNEVLHYVCRVAHMNFKKIKEKHYVIQQKN